jgi:murein DD-endopeptidase MepM/ murein hydrolase activator NlpD
MGFDWNLGTDGDEENLDHSFVVEPAAVAPVEPPAYTGEPLPSRREARRAALAAPMPTPKAVRTASVGERTSARKPIKRSLRRRILPKVLSFGAMLGAGAFLIASTVPANAFMNTASDMAVVTTASSHVQSQKLAEVNAKAVEQTSARDKYTVVSLQQQMALRFTSANWAYTNDPNGTIQWPFPVQVPISTGFGPRQVAGCSFCSTYHLGVDFDPGQGVAIGAIADGVVSQVVESHAGLGNHVVIDHVINGVNVQSVYGHMLDGSIRVTVGEAVTVTQEIGQVGSTGESTGAHLHLEVHVNGTPIDPFAWLKANAN